MIRDSVDHHIEIFTQLCYLAIHICAASGNNNLVSPPCAKKLYQLIHQQ